MLGQLLSLSCSRSLPLQLGASSLRPKISCCTGVAEEGAADTLWLGTPAQDPDGGSAYQARSDGGVQPAESGRTGDWADGVDPGVLLMACLLPYQGSSPSPSGRRGDAGCAGPVLRGLQRVFHCLPGAGCAAPCSVARSDTLPSAGVVQSTLSRAEGAHAQASTAGAGRARDSGQEGVDGPIDHRDGAHRRGGAGGSR